MLKNIKDVVKNTLIYSTGNIFMKLIGVILIPIYTNPDFFSIEDFGVITLIDISIQFMMVFFSLGLYTAFQRWYFDPKYINKQKSLFFTLLSANTLTCLIVSTPVFLFSEQISYILIGSSKYGFIIQLAFISSYLQIIIQMITVLLKLQKKSKIYTISNIIKLISTLSLTIFFIIKLNLGIEGIYYAQILSFPIFLLVLLKVIWNNIEFKLELSEVKRFLMYSIPMIVVSISHIIFTMFDRYGLRLYCTLEDVAIYSLAFRISNTLKVVLTASVQLAIQPLIFKKMYEKGNQRFISKILTYQSFTFVFFTLGLSIFSYEIIYLFINEQSLDSYLKSVNLVSVLALILCLESLRATLMTGFYIAKKTNKLAIIFFVSMILNIILNMIFIPIFGIYGAAYSTLISMILLNIMTYYYGQKLFYIPFEIKKLFINLFVYVLLIVTVYFIPSIKWYYRLPLKVIVILSYFPIMYLFGFFEEIELIVIKQKFKKWKNLKNLKKNLKIIKF